MFHFRFWIPIDQIDNYAFRINTDFHTRRNISIELAKILKLILIELCEKSDKNVDGW